MSGGAYDAVVIGAGENGLVAAAVLGEAGLRVLVLERAETVGGQARTLEFAPGFRAAPLGGDAGWLPPDVARLPGLDRLERVYPDTPLTVAIGVGEMLPLSRDVERAASTLRRHSPADAAKWPEFTSLVRKLSAFLERLYRIPAPDIATNSVREALPLLGVGRALRGLGADMPELLRTLPMPVQQLTEEWFETRALRAGIASTAVQDFRHGPRAGGTGFTLLHHLVGAPAGALRGRGAWTSGPDAFARAAESAARGSGVTVRTSSPVARIEVRDDAVAGVVLENGEEIATTRVLSSADPARTLLGMVDPVWLDPDIIHALRNIRFRGCTAAVLYALDALPELPEPNGLLEALRGALSLTPELDTLERAADAVKYGQVPERPHIELHAPSLLWSDLAPAGKHVLVARVSYAPYRLRADDGWTPARATALAENVSAAIEGVLPGFTPRVLQRAVLTPRDLEERFALTEGAPTHGELGLDQILFMRPLPGFAHYASPIDGLWLCGAGCHPGPGVTGGPGWLAARRFLRRTRP